MGGFARDELQRGATLAASFGKHERTVGELKQRKSNLARWLADRS
jgi:hypothetical protein